MRNTFKRIVVFILCLVLMFNLGSYTVLADDSGSHEHTDDCYIYKAEKHTHTDSCYDADYCDVCGDGVIQVIFMYNTSHEECMCDGCNNVYYNNTVVYECRDHRSSWTIVSGGCFSCGSDYQNTSGSPCTHSSSFCCTTCNDKCYKVAGKSYESTLRSKYVYAHNDYCEECGEKLYSYYIEVVCNICDDTEFLYVNHCESCNGVYNKRDSYPLDYECMSMIPKNLCYKTEGLYYDENGNYLDIHIHDDTCITTTPCTNGCVKHTHNGSSNTYGGCYTKEIPGGLASCYNCGGDGKWSSPCAYYVSDSSSAWVASGSKDIPCDHLTVSKTEYTHTCSDCGAVWLSRNTYECSACGQTASSNVTVSKGSHSSNVVRTCSKCTKDESDGIYKCYRDDYYVTDCGFYDSKYYKDGEICSVCNGGGWLSNMTCGLEENIPGAICDRVVVSLSPNSPEQYIDLIAE